MSVKNCSSTYLPTYQPTCLSTTYLPKSCLRSWWSLS